MAIIKCLKCGNDISDKALKCPKCGSVTELKVNSVLNDIASAEQEENKSNKIFNDNLILCPDCGKKVSKNADNCIYCGAPIKKNGNKYTKVGNVFLGISLIFDISGLFSILSIVYGALALAESEKVNSGKKNAKVLNIVGAILIIYQYCFASSINISLF